MANVFGQGFITIDGELVAENTSYNTSLERSNVADVYSITGNFEGTDIGPLVRVVSAENIVGSGILWEKVEKMYFEGRKVFLGVQDVSSKQFVSEGRFVAVSRSGGVGQTQTLSFTFRGTPTAMV